MSLPEQVVQDIATALGEWAYLLVGGMAFLETGAFIGLVAPGEFTVILGGVLAGQGEIELLPLIGIVWACALLGDSTSFAIGRRVGMRWPKRASVRRRLEQVERYFERHGGKTILIGRFIGLVRALAPFVAGASRMRYRRFLPYSVLGTGIWTASFSLLGFLFWRSFTEVAEIAGRATVGLGIFLAAIVGGVWGFRHLRRSEAGRRLEAWVRRPGTLLGIELASAVAVSVAGLYVFAVYVVVLSGGESLTAGDRLGLDVARDLGEPTVVDVAKVLTELGAFPVVGGLALAVAAFLAWRRRPGQVAVLAGGLALVYMSVQAAKAGVERPRPPGGLVDTEGKSYPSGHAAYGTTYVALAVILRRPALVVAALGVVAFIGLSRIYLRVHYWSDVAGGWGLGLGAFATSVAGALLVARIRNNERPRG